WRAVSSAARFSAASFSAYGKRFSSFILLLNTPQSMRLRTITFVFERLGLAAAFFFSLPFFFSAASPADPPCFSAASACSRNSRRLTVRFAMNAFSPVGRRRIHQGGACPDAAIPCVFSERHHSDSSRNRLSSHANRTRHRLVPD